MANQTQPLQLINMDMAMDEAGLQSFVRTVLDGEGGGGARYFVVSMLGPQSSGKSTLLNSLFGTDFQVMDATKNWDQTTKGIFLAKFKEVLLIMDVEGSDSAEKQGQIQCERKLAAFSFAMSQVVLVNMKNDSIGLDSGGCKSLLEAALELMICFLGHHTITLIIVVCDKHRDTPVVTIQMKVKQRIDQIWKNIRKPEDLQEKNLDDCLDVKVVVMHSYVHEKDNFVEEVSQLSKVIVSSQGREKYSARQFARKAREQWQMINNHPELNIQTYKELIDHKRCDKVKLECIGFFEKELSKILKRQSAEFSGHEVEESRRDSLKKYDEATKSSTASVTSEVKEILKSELVKIWKNAFEKCERKLRREILQSFGKVLKERLKSDTHSDAATIVEGCTTESLKEYQKRCRGMMSDHVQWDTTDCRKLLVDNLQKIAAGIFHSVRNQVKFKLAMDSFVAAVVAAGFVADAVFAGGAVSTASATAGIVAAGTGAGLMSMVASFPIVEPIKRVCKNAKFLAKNRNYHPEKPSASDNLEKPSTSEQL